MRARLRLAVKQWAVTSFRCSAPERRTWTLRVRNRRRAAAKVAISLRRDEPNSVIGSDSKMRVLCSKTADQSSCPHRSSHTGKVR